MNSWRAETIGNVFPISLPILSFSFRPVVTDIHTILSYSHLSVVPMATPSLFLKEPLKSACECDCQAGGNVNDLYLWQHQQCLINGDKQPVMTVCVSVIRRGRDVVLLVWHHRESCPFTLGKKPNSEQWGWIRPLNSNVPLIMIINNQCKRKSSVTNQMMVHWLHLNDFMFRNDACQIIIAAS